MRYDEKVVDIESRDYWFKVVEFLQQNWALVDVNDDGSGCTIFFIGDTSGVFDQMAFSTVADALGALQRNGFSRYADEAESQNFISVPEPPFQEASHPNGPIYSSGRFWK